MSFARRVALAAAVGCGLMTVQAREGGGKKPPLDDSPIKAVVAYFAKNGVPLQKDKDGFWWVVTDPKAEGYEVTVSLRTFPAKATEQEMRNELRRINLAYRLNARARVAMSYPGLRGTRPESKPPPLDQVPVAAKLEKLFKEYRPPETKE